MGGRALTTRLGDAGCLTQEDGKGLALPRWHSGRVWALEPDRPACDPGFTTASPCTAGESLTVLPASRANTT